MPNRSLSNRMKLRTPKRWQRTSRGQALVEMAVLIPLLALLLVMAVDLGRVFFGWVSLTNSARIGANYAAQFPDTWTTGDIPKNQKYERLIRDNLAGCALDSVVSPGSADSIDDPTFTQKDSTALTPANREPKVGDLTKVQLHCKFSLLTPLAGILVGDEITIGAASTFPVRAGEFASPGGGGVGAPPCIGVRVPDLRTMTVDQASDFWTNVSGFTGAFTASPSGQPDYIVQTQATTPGASIGACVDPSTTVYVTATAPPPCPAGQQQVPNLIGLTVDQARLTWSAAFSGGFSPSSGHGTDSVLSQTTSPSNVAAGGCLASTGSVTVTYGAPPVPQCDVPDMIGYTGNEARTRWSVAGFTRTLTVQGNATWTVLTQDPQQPARVACDIQGKVTT